MGAVAIDVNANERKLEVMFPMHTKDGMEVFLENINQLNELKYYSGDFDAVIMLVDFEKAFAESGLTALEKGTIRLVFMEDMKRVQVANMMNVTKQTVQTRLNRAIEKLANYYNIRGVQS